VDGGAEHGIRPSIRSDHRGRLPVHVAPIAEPDDEDAQDRVLDARDDAVIADPVFPQFAEARTLERRANEPRIVELGQAFMQKAKDAPRRLMIELVEFALGDRIKLNLPYYSVS
jgi:hypothetical protein